jgi:hypothetical protein
MCFLLLTQFFQDDVLCHYAGYTEQEILPVWRIMAEYLAKFRYRTNFDEKKDKNGQKIEVDPDLPKDVDEFFFKKYSNKKYLKGKQAFALLFSTTPTARARRFFCSMC